MTKIRIRSDVHPGEEVMDGVDRAYEHLLQENPAVEAAARDRQAKFIEELRVLGRARRRRRETQSE